MKENSIIIIYLFIYEQGDVVRKGWRVVDDKEMKVRENKSRKTKKYGDES